MSTPRENYYLLLELDPAEQDPVRLLDALRRRQSRWSADRNSPSPARSKQAQLCLGLVPDIEAVFRDEGRRRAEAAEALRLREARRAEALAGLDRDLDLTGAKGYLTPADVASLLRAWKERLGEAEVRDRARQRDLEVRDAPPQAAPGRELLDPALFRNVAASLAVLGKPDLYGFLDLPRTASARVLRERAELRLREARSRIDKTAEVSAVQELAGHCLALFAGEGERAKYDASLADQALDGLRRLAETAASGEGRVSARLMDRLLEEAARQGLSAEVGRQAVLDLARRKGWAVAESETPSLAAQQVCGACRNLGPAGDSACARCGTPYRLACPRCGTVNGSTARYCTRAGCGFAIGDMALAPRVVAEARSAVHGRDFSRARELLDQAREYWPGMSAAEELQQSLRQLVRAEEVALEQAERACSGRRFHAARDAIDLLRREAPGHPRVAALEGLATRGQAAAAEQVARARKCEQAGQVDAAADAWLEALHACADHPEALAGLERCPPAPAGPAEASVAGPAVVVRWQPSPSAGAVRYRVVRKAGEAPRAEGDGDLVGEVSEASLTDATTEAGEVYHYAVWAVRNRGTAARPTRAGPVLRLEEVAELRALGGDRAATLTYRAPARARAVVVWRAAGGPPPARGGPGGPGAPAVASASLTSATDTGLTNGQPYGYRVAAVFTGADGRPVRTPGLTCVVVPTEPPRPVNALRVTRQPGGQFEAAWAPVPAGSVQVYAGPRRPAHRPGDLLAPADLPRLGSPLAPATAASVRGQVEANQDLYLVPVTILGSAVVLGRAAALGWVEDVEGLAAQAGQGVLVLRWTWPAGVDSVVVAWRDDQSPEGPDDPRARREVFDRPRYESNGGYRLAQPPVQELHLCVYAAVRHGEGWRHATGAGPGCRLSLPVGKARTLYYRIAPRTQYGLFRTGEYELRLLPSAPTELPDLILAVKPGGLPLDPDDGARLVGVLAGSRCSPEQPLVVPFTPGPGFAARAARLFPAEEGHCAWLELVWVP